MNAKAVALLVLLAGTALILRMRGVEDHVVMSRPLDMLPERIGAWQGKDISITADVRQVLGNGRFLNRSYVSTSSAAAAMPVDLLIAYFPTQRSGQTIHSPQNCLPGAGWTFESSQRLTVTDTAGLPHQVGEYLVTNGSAHLEVLYWYRSRGHDIASDYAAKGYLLVQAIRDRRTDGALIRVMTPVLPGEQQADARRRVAGLTAELEPLLPPFLPN